MNVNRDSNSQSLKPGRGLWLILLVGLAILLTACGEATAIADVPPPIPTVTPLPGQFDPIVPTTTPAPAGQPAPVGQPINAKPQPVGPVPVVEGVIEVVATENNLSVLTVNKTRYTIIPEITARIGKWFQVGNHIKMSGTRYSDGTNLITLVINVDTPAAAQPNPPEKKPKKDKGEGDD